MDVEILMCVAYVAISTAAFLVFTNKLKKKIKDNSDELSRKETLLENLKKENVAFKEKYSPILSIEDKIDNLNKDFLLMGNKISGLRVIYSEKRAILDRLEQQIAIYDERLSFAELGLYEPHFEFRDSETYKERIVSIREQQKEMIAAKSAAICATEWTVEGSKSKGQTMVNRQMRLTMRAFNNECEAAIANVRWNNVNAMEKRIQTAAAAIDKENKSLSITLNPKYISLKLNELYMTHEYREKQKSEKDERAEMARLEREEKKLLAEAEAAEREERRYQDLLDKARKEAGAGSESAQSKIMQLEAALAEAHAAAERAKAMAELTKSGYVYIISNIGSFGEDVVKIGLTRRLDPEDRVRELGDASVPFSFDTHAMIYSEEAPSLEAALHRAFADRRINMSNFRKEFFRVKLDEVEQKVKELAPTAAFFKDREAQEWHETLARRNAVLESLQMRASKDFPEQI